MSKSNIYTFLLNKNNIIFKVNVIKKIEKEISILVEKDPKNCFDSYSAKIAIINIINKEKKELDLLDYFYKQKAFIKEEDNSFMIICINSIENYYKKEDVNNIEIDNNKKTINVILNRNEYYVLWRDPNFSGKNSYSNYLEEQRLYCIEEANMAIHCIDSTEKALKLVSRRINDNIIFITSIRYDLSGRRFIEIVREMYGFNVIVLFYSSGNRHLDWVQDFPNCLYTDNEEIYKKYLTNFKKEGLKNLKKICESEYNIKLNNFNDDFLRYSNSNRIFISSPNPYIRQVKTDSRANSKY
jgi:hypothetical protein